MSIEQAEAKGYAIATAQADAQLLAIPIGSATSGIADTGTPEPWVVINSLPGTDQLSSSGERLVTAVLVQIEAVARIENYTLALAAANRLDELFRLVRNASHNTISILTIIRKSSFDREELASDSTRYVHIGGLYKFQLR